MEFNKETFEKALKANKIVRYQQHFEAVVKSYLEIENQALRQLPVSGSLPSQKELIELIKEMHKYSLYKISEQDDRPTHLPHWLFDKVEMVIGNDR